ncbi:MAG: LysR substrate-binding domain-containing protein [Pseudomonadota bacterium]
MSGRLPPLSALRTFEAAAHWESFAKAADDLCVSQSAVSQQIRILEEDLQVRLFERLGNRVALTEDGRALGARLSEAFEIIAEACAQTTRSKGKAALRISAETAFASRWLRPRLADFRAAHPEIQVTLQAGATGDPSADIAVHFEKRLNEATHGVERLFPIDGYPACAPAFLMQNPDIHAPEDIARLPLIHDNTRMIWRRWFARFLPGSEAWRSGYVYSDLALAIDAAADGDGVFLADDRLCAREIASGALVHALSETVRCAWYALAIHHERAGDRPVQAFAEWLRTAVEDDIGAEEVDRRSRT